MASAHRSVTGRSLNRSIMACYLDAALYMNHCEIPSLTYGPLTKNIHGIDECVNLPSLKRVTQTIALFLRQNGAAFHQNECGATELVSSGLIAAAKADTNALTFPCPALADRHTTTGASRVITRT
ncbi:hypothetical protein QW131_03150 [Roseibium salinum]|nr:hypothetical protein [Roseibium salinum]